MSKPRVYRRHPKPWAMRHLGRRFTLADLAVAYGDQPKSIGASIPAAGVPADMIATMQGRSGREVDRYADV